MLLAREDTFEPIEFDQASSRQLTKATAARVSSSVSARAVRSVGTNGFSCLPMLLF
jgi:hypothetical protein